MLMKNGMFGWRLFFCHCWPGFWLTKGQQPPHIHGIAGYQLTLIMIQRRFYSLAVDTKAKRVDPANTASDGNILLWSDGKKRVAANEATLLIDGNWQTLAPVLSGLLERKILNSGHQCRSFVWKKIGDRCSCHAARR
jgi:hypothetical protein